MDSGETTQPASGEPEWLAARPRLRDGLIFAPRSVAGRPGYVIEDPGRGKFFRLGVAEYALVASLDGQTSVATAIERARHLDPQGRFGQQEALVLCNWLATEQLLEPVGESAAGLLRKLADRHQRQQRASWQNPLMMRIPLLRPERLVTRLVPWLGWIGSRWTLMATALLVLIALAQLVMSWPQFTRSLTGVFSGGGQMQLLLVWLGLKIVHEVAHAVVCKRYGAEVREAGVLLLLFMPIAFVDVTSSWRLRSKVGRIHIAAAGMLVELLIAAIAVLVWASSSPGVIQQLSANVVLLASLTTVLFNANPLMRFDGYYILADLLEIPNLYGLGQQWMRYAFRRYVSGLPASLPPWPPRRGRLVRTYAVASAVWRICVYAGLLTAAAVLWHGFGIVLAVIGGVLWIGLPSVRWAKIVILGDGREKPNRLRLAIVATTLAAVLVATFTLLPWPGARRIHGVVKYAPEAILRAASDAFVETVCVHSGQPVSPGDVLLQLRNEELSLEAAKLDMEIERSGRIARRHRKRSELAALQAELKALDALTKQRAVLAEQLEQLTVRAPIAGMVVSPRVESLEGAYVKAGEELLVVGSAEQKEVQLAVGQDDVDDVNRYVGSQVAIVTAGGVRVCGRLDRVSPRATSRPIDPAMTATHGGPLTVRSVVGSEEGEEAMRLLTPHFMGTTTLAPIDSERLFAGQRVTVYYGAPRDSLGGHLWRLLRTWFSERLRPA